MKDSLNLVVPFKAVVEISGGMLIAEYYAFGRYDIVTKVEDPNDETTMSAMLATGRLGNVSNETLKAFPLSEAAKMIEQLLRN